MRILYLFFLLTLSFSSFATNYYAVIVGVSEYPSLDKALSLNGPKNDVLRVRSMLLQQGIQDENIKVLADGVVNAQLPTKKNIVTSIKSLENKLQKGDFVYLHFSGHGSQQPAISGSDGTDGLDEIFLPRDIGTWSQQLGTVENSLVDDEVNILITMLRNKGADVWVIFDSCHSGTMTRSITGQKVVSRSVRPKTLGVNYDTALISTGIPLQELPLLKKQSGSLVVFSGAQSNEEAPEMDLSNGDEKVPQGLFTYTMTSLIGQNPNISYRQLAQGILSAYNSLPWHKTIPNFEGGTFLDKPIFNRDTEVNFRYPTKRKNDKYFIQGGQVNGFENGALVAVFDTVDSKENIALLEVTNSKVASSQGILIEGKIEKNNTFIELIKPAYPEPLTVKWQEQPAKVWQDALSNLLNKNKLLSRTIKWVDSSKSSDISLYVSNDTLYFFSIENEYLPCELVKNKQQCQADGEYLGMHYSLTNNNGISQVLESGISRFVRARNLMRLSFSMAGKSSISSEVLLNEQPVKLDNVVQAKDGDEIYVSFSNSSRKPVDLIVFFVDSGLGIYQVYPEPGYSGRLFAGESAEFEGVVSASTRGEEQFVIISVPTSNQSPQITLSHLQQEPMESMSFFKSKEVKTRGGMADIFAQSLGDAPKSRSFTAKKNSEDKASVSIIRLRVQ